MTEKRAEPSRADGAVSQPGRPDPEAVARARALAASLGGIVSIMIRSPEYRGMKLSDLEWLVGPPLATEQFGIAEGHDSRTGLVAPVAAVLWANVSGEIDRRLGDPANDAPRLEPKDWRSGDIPWIISAFGDKRALAGLLQQLARTQFKDKAAKIRVRGEDGKVSVVEIKPQAPGAVRTTPDSTS